MTKEEPHMRNIWSETGISTQCWLADQRGQDRIWVLVSNLMPVGVVPLMALKAEDMNFMLRERDKEWCNMRPFG